MATTTLLQNIQQGVPSGNYDGSSSSFYGNAGRCNGFYLGYSGVQQVEIRIENFYGRVIIQGTLGSVPLTAAWVDLTSFDYNDSSLNTLTASQIVLGEYVFMRALVTEFESGKIDYLNTTFEIREDY